MSQDLAALAPSVIVCAAFIIGVWAVVRRELAPRRRARAQAKLGPAGPGQPPEPADREHGGS